MRKISLAFFSVVGLLLVAVLGFVLWASHPRKAEPEAYALAMQDPAIVITGRDGFITIRPNGAAPATGLLFYPGLRIAPEAYVAKLAAIAKAADIQIAIGRPRLNVAAFSINQADEMRSALPGVTHWYVGGHSLGGAIACLYASRNSATLLGVVLLSTYCGSDLSKSNLRILQVVGDHDGVMPPETIVSHRAELPSRSEVVTIAGMDHAQVGNYGTQPGDHPASITDNAVKGDLARIVASFIQSNR